MARFAATAASPAVGATKMQVLHKILTGEAQFKNKVPVKESYVEQQFGEGWKKELAEYTATLPEAQKAVLNRQVARLSLTRYTTRELAQYAGEVESVDVVAARANIADGVAFLKAKGESDFVAHVNKEAKLSNWSDEQKAKFIAAVKAAK